ncbi:MAG: MarR family transcriptional regulator [Proteobacteria bacterium]|nr:MarR family transcriptional regulator [Pseudomonadota bacterium]
MVNYDLLQDQIKQVIYLIRRLIQAEELYTKELEKKYRVSVPQLSCLLALYENGPMPPSQVAKHIMVKSSTVTGIIDRLEQKRLVERSRISSDRRVITIGLTESGRMLAQNSPLPIQERIVDGYKDLPSNEREDIIRALKKLSSMLDSNAMEAE